MIFPFECHSNYSILEGFANISNLVARASELKLPAVALTDTHSVSGAIEFFQEVEKHNKKGKHVLKPILGCVLQTDGGRLLVLCKNKNGYFELLELLSQGSSINTQNIPFESNNLIFPLKDYNLKYRPVFYINPEDKRYQNILVCSKNKCTLKDLNVSEEDKRFFSETFAFELVDGEDDSQKILDQIESFSINAQPEVPVFTTEDADETLAQLCREGWISRKLNEQTKNNPQLKAIYTTRIKEELRVFKEAGGLANYMLIVRDIVQFCHNHKQSCGLRGSAVGCLTSYLIGISNVDPVRPDPTLPHLPSRELLFSRFYSWVRNTPGNVALPDIDIDIPTGFREKVITYLRGKYGQDRVGYIITFARLDGRGALKEVFRITEPDSDSFATADRITKNMVDTAKVQDVLEDLKEENPNYNIIQFNIDHVPAIAEAYKEYKEEFETAIKLSNCIKSHGRHAAGIVITNSPIGKRFPVIHDDKTNETIVAYEMVDLELAGGVKFDLLGVAAYDKIDQICHMINNNELEIKELI